jgi:hypothetical protein
MAIQHDIEPLSKQLTIVVGLTVVGFMAFGLALSFYRNILFEGTLRDIKDQNEQIARDIDAGYGDLEYYGSAQYKDKYAKENLNLVREGEKVLIITQPPKRTLPHEEDTEAEKARREAAYMELLRQMPVQLHWNLYLFYPERIEEMKKAL